MSQPEPLYFTEFKNSKNSHLPHYFVVGHPIAHSLSPLMHNLALKHYSLDATYYSIDLHPRQLTDFIAWVNRDEFLGCNVTIPWKRELMNLPDVLSPEVEAVGALNTLSKTEGGTRILGNNTDIYGFSQPLEAYEDILSRQRAIIFGSGGASLAVQYALDEMDFEEQIIVSRRPGRVQALEGRGFKRVVGYNQWQSFADEAELFINTTPLGMGSIIDESPVDYHDTGLLKDKLCYDLVYNPLKTTFLREAESAGAETIGGLDMLIQQGSRSFEIWTGHPFPIHEVKQELLTYFNNQ